MPKHTGRPPLRTIICPTDKVRCYQTGKCPVCRVEWRTDDAAEKEHEDG